MKGRHEGKGRDSLARSTAMLRQVLDGQTYESVAAEHGITRTAVERRVKVLAMRLCREVGVAGLNPIAAGFVSRLRDHRSAILDALDAYRPASSAPPRADRVLSEQDIASAASRIRARAARPWRDLALFYVLLATGARPLEIARLCVGEYLAADGTVRRESEMPAQASIAGRARPLYFASRRLDEALGHYLQERLELGQGVGGHDAYRGLDPASRLFLTAGGEPFRIVPYGTDAQRRHLCRPILETYRRLLRQAELEGTTAMSIRRTVVARLFDRGADEEQIGLVLGISDRNAVRELLPRTRRDIACLVDELI